MARTSVQREDRSNSSGGRAPSGVLMYQDDPQGGLPMLAPHDSRSATFNAVNPLRGVAGAGTTQARRVSGDAQPPLLQRLSGTSNRHPLLSDYEPAEESWWAQSTCLQRGFVVLCLALLFGLSGLIAFEITDVLNESRIRSDRSAAQGAAHWTVQGCHWTQIRLPTSLSTADITIQVSLMQPSATLQEIGAYVEQGHDFNYCFVVHTQGVSAISSSMLEDTNEAGVVKPMKQTGVYLLLNKQPIHVMVDTATLKIHFARKQASSPAPGALPVGREPAHLSINGAAAEEDLECWKECIEYDSVCDDEHAPVRRHLAQFNLGYSSAKSLVSKSVSERECKEISTCAEQRYMHNCGWCQSGTSVVDGRGIQCERDEMLPDKNCIPSERCNGFWTWQSSLCPRVGNGVCVLKVICKRYRKTCVGYQELQPYGGN